MSEDYIDEEEPQRITSDIGQFAMVPAWVRQALRNDAGKVDVMALAVFGVLAEKADQSGDRHDFRSTKVIATELGVDPGTVRRALQHLREVGAIDWTPRTRADGSQTTNDYQVFFADPGRPDASTPARQSATYNGRASERDGAARQDARKKSHTVSSHTVSQTLAAPEKTAPQQRKRDVVFEALADVCGIDWNRIASSERGALNKAAAELRPLHVTPDEIVERAGNYRVLFENAPLTPSALVRHWGKCEHPPAPKQRAAPPALEFLRSRNGAAAIDVKGEIR